LKEKLEGKVVVVKETKAKAQAKKIQKMKKEFQDAIRSVEKSAEKAEEMFGKKDAPAMRRMYQKDAKDLRRVYKLWLRGKYNEADEVAW
jgi:23S rRNA maturation mini-RNase III